MFCAIVENEVSPSDLDRLCQVVREHRNPLATRQTGFKEVFLLTKSSGEYMLVTFWETEEQANAWYENPEHLALAPLFMPIMKRPPSSEGRHIYKIQDHVTK